MKEYDLNWIAAVAKAACLELSENRLSEMAKSVGAELDELSDLRGYGETEWGDRAVSISEFREDAVRDCLDKDALLSSATCRIDDYFSVLEVLSEGGASS